ncbi:MAG: LysE/ArgO family amino acid transporter [Alphaproteobacteria bacterium]|nr:LysE/ArgO family amino acid transporter [Alphaproteobacteria bacterium]
MFIQGFTIGLSLILAIGPQNAFVIRQGLKGKLVFLTAIAVSLCDSALIAAGVLGVGQFLARVTWLKLILTIGGMSFLAIYGGGALIRVFRNNRLQVKKTKDRTSYKKIILQSVSFSWLNPHAILDTLVIIGSISAQYNMHDAVYFGAGAIVSSFVWFFALAFVAKVLSKYLQKPITWKIIDLFVGVVCLKIAYGLLVELL